MNLKGLVFISLFLATLLPSSLHSESYLGGQPRLPESTRHPYLLFHRSDVPQLRARKNQSPLFARWYSLISSCGQGGTQSDALAAAFMFQMTDSTKYLDLPRDYLFSITEAMIDTSTDNNLTRHARIAAFVYDWIEPGLKKEENRQARENLIRLLEYHFNWVKFEDRNEFILEKNGWSNNHNFGHQAAAALLAITLPEHWVSMRCLEMAMNYQFEQFQYYIRAAPYFEGSNYTDIFIDLAIPQFYAAYRHACGIDVFSDHRIPLERMFYTSFVTQRMPDGHTDPTRGAPLDFMHITRQDNKRPFWRFLVSMLHKPDDLNWALGNPANDHSMGDNWRLVFPYIAYKETIPFDKIPADGSSQYMNGNHEIVFRKDWTYYSSFLHFYGRKIATGYHGHCEQLTFNACAHGARLVTDFEDDGNSIDMSQPNYHNVILADGEMAVDRIGYPEAGQPMKSILDRTTVKRFFESNAFDGGEISVDYAYTGNFYYSVSDIVDLKVGDVSVSRSIYYIKDMSDVADNEYWIVLDDVDADRTHDYEWLLHGIGTISGSGNESRTFATKNSKNEDVSLFVQFISPDVDIVDRKQDSYGQHIAALVTGRNLDFKTVLYPYKPGSMARPVITRLGSGGQRGFLLVLEEDGGVVEDLCYSQEGNPVAEPVLGSESDAELSFIRKIDGRPYSMMLKNGSRFSLNGKPIIESTGILDIVCLRIDGEEIGVIDGIIQCSMETDVNVFDTRGSLVHAGRYGPGSHDVLIRYEVEEYRKDMAGADGDKYLDTGILLPQFYGLSQNFPNPFNPSTTIAFDIPAGQGKGQDVKLVVYDTRGRYVRTLVDSELEPGRHSVYWDGRNGRGEPVPSGVYLYTLESDGLSITRKMTVLK